LYKYYDIRSFLLYLSFWNELPSEIKKRFHKELVVLWGLCKSLVWFFLVVKLWVNQSILQRIICKYHFYKKIFEGLLILPRIFHSIYIFQIQYSLWTIYIRNLFNIISHLIKVFNIRLWYLIQFFLEILQPSRKCIT